MANIPDSPNDKQSQSSSNGPASVGKPRATIMMKKNNPAGGSSPVIVPASSNAPGSSARIVPAQSARMSPAASARRPAVPVDREALGLSSARPSEMVSGLNEAAKRAEAAAERAEAKRKSGGKMNLTTALHVDDTGARWKRQVIFGIVGIVVLGTTVFLTLMFFANRQKISDRAAFEETRGTLNALAKQAELMKSFEDGENVTLQNVKDRLIKELEASQKEIQEQLKRDANAKRNPDTRSIERRNFIEKLLTFKDGWKKPLVIQMSGTDDVEFSSTGKYEGASLEPIKVRIRAGSGSSEKIERQEIISVRNAVLIAILILLNISNARLFALDINIGDLTAPPLSTPDTRIINDDGCVLISKDAKVLAAIRIRASTPQSADTPVIALDAARAGLAKDKVKREHVKENQFPLEGTTPGATMGVLMQTRPVTQGARMLVTSQISPAKISGSPAPPAVEIAVQIFPDTEGNPLKLTYLDGDPAPEKSVSALELRARAMTFEILKKQRVTLERSAPASWTVRRVANSIVLTARLVPDAHAPEKFGSFILFAGAAHDEDPPEVSAIKLNKTQLPARDYIEGWARVYVSGANPYVLSEAAVVAEIAMPPRSDGSIPTKLLPCFFYESADPSKHESEFRFRFAPPSEGLYGVRLYVTTPANKCNSETEAFRAGVPASPGSARIRKGERFFRLDDGTLHTPVGLDLSRFGLAEGADVFRNKLIELHRCGGNTIAVTLSRLLPLEGSDAGRINPKAAELLDQIFMAAESRGIGVILALENGPDIGKDSARHPYFREMGGPLIAQPEYFRDPAAKRFYQVRLTYAAARYGAFRSLMSWDLMRNLDDAWPALKKDPEDKSLGLSPREIDLSRRLRRDVEDWVGQMAQQLRGLDQHNHPICISTALDPDKSWRALLAQEHINWAASRDFADTGARTLEERFPALNFSLAQWAADARGPKRPLKPWGVLAFGLQQNSVLAQISSIVNGLPMTPLLPADPNVPMTDNDRTTIRVAGIFGAALAEISSSDSRDELSVITDSSGTAKLFGRSGKRGLAAWILNPNQTTAQQVEFKLPGLLEGTYSITWLDPRTGLVIASQPHLAPAQQINKTPEAFILRPPVFEREIAVFVVKESKR